MIQSKAVHAVQVDRPGSQAGQPGSQAGKLSTTGKYSSGASKIVRGSKTGPLVVRSTSLKIAGCGDRAGCSEARSEHVALVEQ